MSPNQCGGHHHRGLRRDRGHARGHPLLSRVRGGVRASARGDCPSAHHHRHGARARDREIRACRENGLKIKRASKREVTFAMNLAENDI